MGAGLRSNLVCGLDYLPIVRLTIDSYGIRRQKRLLAGEPRYLSRRFDNVVFIIENEGRFDSVSAVHVPDSTPESGAVEGSRCGVGEMTSRRVLTPRGRAEESDIELDVSTQEWCL